MSETTQTTYAGRREWLGLAILALPCLLYSMDLTILNLAIPHLSADLAPSSAQLLWIMDIWMAETSSELGGALGIALLGSLLTAIYRRELSVSLWPGGSA